jgi:hypothetical protein
MVTIDFSTGNYETTMNLRRLFLYLQLCAVVVVRPLPFDVDPSIEKEKSSEDDYVYYYLYQCVVIFRFPRFRGIWRKRQKTTIASELGKTCDAGERSALGSLLSAATIDGVSRNIL